MSWMKDIAVVGLTLIGGLILYGVIIIIIIKSLRRRQPHEKETSYTEL
jgi:hypothetical protein